MAEEKDPSPSVEMDSQEKIVRAPSIPIARREFIAILLFVMSMDYLLYIESGAFTIALVFLITPFIIFIGAPQRTLNKRLFLVTVLILLLTIRCLWQINAFSIVLGVMLVTVFAIMLSNASIGFLAALILSPLTLCTGFNGLVQYKRGFSTLGKNSNKSIDARTVLIPFFIILIFFVLFFFGNTLLREKTGEMFQRLGDFFQQFTGLWELEPQRILFWGVCVVLATAFLRPFIQNELKQFIQKTIEEDPEKKNSQLDVSLHRRIALNTLIPINILFVLYNLFDAYYLIGAGKLPPGMNHSQYAHQGALWLTVALALSTLVLSYFFRIDIPEMKKCRTTKFFAFIWWLQNLVLALWVYWRLAMYIDYNGLTRMRIIGMAGTTLVLVGFILMAYKIYYDRHFKWLIIKEMTALSIAGILLVLAPLDILVWSVNTPLILKQQTPYAAVQLAVQPISSEAMPLLLPLLEHPDEDVARLAAARLGQWAENTESSMNEKKTAWRHWQGVNARNYPKVKQSWPRIIELIPDTDWHEKGRKGYRYTSKWI